MVFDVMLPVTDSAEAGLVAAVGTKLMLWAYAVLVTSVQDPAAASAFELG